MKLGSIVAAAAIAGLASTPSFALFCSNEGPSAGEIVTYKADGERVVRPDTEAQKAMDLRRLRDIGVNASSVERWNGCLRAFVRQADGAQGMEFYDPGTLERLQ